MVSHTVNFLWFIIYYKTAISLGNSLGIKDVLTRLGVVEDIIVRTLETFLSQTALLVTPDDLIPEVPHTKYVV